ncbi:NADP-dependent oxidoreductase [Actinoplanes solisilvae]|uniref:NADP-dependent oxidoreductase n=1 Tax=Actinoplanes solisilvae TaxID=2486853 RepID=UPI000FDAD0D8|nr:NADP-dependent oxidoreductase [Actinoplanes solisilvae]
MTENQMRALRLYRYGGPEELRYEHAPVPSPGPGEVLLRVAATSFNPGDTFVRAGGAHHVLPRTFPFVPGIDAAGTVVRLGPGVTGFAVGDQVIGYLSGPREGAAAEYTVAAVDRLGRAPSTIPLADAAALPVAALTAWQAFHQHLRVTAGQQVLINGAGGGVGRFAVQFAKRAGATVVGVAGPSSIEHARTAGANEVLDRTSNADHRWDRPADPEPIPRFDAVFNTAAAPTSELDRLATLIRPGGAFLSIASIPHHRPGGVRVSTMTVRPNPADLAEIARLVDEGAVTLGITERHPVARTADIHRRHHAGDVHGKVILSH